MRWFSELGRRLRKLFHPEQFDADLKEEMRLHRELREQEQVEAGVAPEEARYAAQRRFGNDLVLREESRDMWEWTWLENILQDLRYSFRILGKNPSFTAVAVLTLALGIGANTAIFSVVNAVLLRPLPYPDPDRLAVIWVTEPSAPGGLFPDTAPDFRDWQAQNQVFEGISAVTIAGATLTGSSEPLQLRGLSVSPNTFQILGVQPQFGRSFSQDEGPTGRNHVVILSYGLWQSAFGGQKNIVGRKVTMDGETYDVVGVMPKDLRFPTFWGRNPQFWTPITMDAPKWKTERSNHWFWVLARMKKGITLNQAADEMGTISARLAQQYPQSNTGVIARVKSLHEQLTGNVSEVLWVLFAAVGFLLLIACVNVANLLLTKSVGRKREIAVRLAVGAGAGRLVRQLLTESVLLFLLGGVAGLAVGVGALRLLLHAAPTGYIPEVISVHLDGRVFGFTFLIAFVTGTLAGLIPALEATRLSFSKTLKESGAAVAAPHGLARGLLTAGEIALALVMLVGAGLATRSLVRLLGVQLGFDPRQVVTGSVSLPDSRYPKEPQQKAFFRSLLDRVQALPGVVSAGAASELPLEGGSNGPVVIEGQPAPKDQWSSPLVESCTVTPNYFRTMRIPMLSGRDVAENDTPDVPLVAVINESMARRFWPHQDAVGKRFRHNDPDAKWITVIGVVGDVREFALAEPAIPEAYYPESQSTSSGLVLVVRTANDPQGQVPAIRKALHDLDKDLPWYSVQALPEMVSDSSREKRFVALLLALFAAVALTLASVGIYGVVSYSVSQRTREIGIRMAFGAEVRTVLGMVVREGLRLIITGVLVGLLGAWALSRYLNSILYGVRGTDLVTYIFAALLMTLVALVACLVPARRATKVDPMVALRYE
ncbi:MAG: ABC transporter permease [Terriglobia bacterium]|jgi:putative ABC transport system permease protein